MIHHIRITTAAAVLVLILIVATRAEAQGSMTWHSVDAAGGGYNTSAGMLLYSSVGQPYGGLITTTAASMSAGFIVPSLFQTTPPSTPQLSLSTSGLDFGNVAVNTTPERTVVIMNTGNSDLVITRQRVSGGDSTEFAITQGAATTIPPSGSSTMYISHTPRSAGGKTSSIRIECNDPSNPVSTITLTSNAVTTAVSSDAAPIHLALDPAYPNPLLAAGNGSSIIRYAVDREANIDLVLYDQVGRLVATLAQGLCEPGSYLTRFFPDPQLSAGMYIIILRASARGEVSSLSRTLVVMR
ncbi:MAG: choice-of-anchor D domain-containing protein [Bacteroidota bacterium]